jgi:hypothetical protein
MSTTSLLHIEQLPISRRGCNEETAWWFRHVEPLFAEIITQLVHDTLVGMS